MPFEPAATDYRAPPPHICREINNPIPLTTTTELYLHLRTYKTLVVKFSIEQREWVDNLPQRVARCDTSHSRIHVHQFYSADPGRDDVREIEIIPSSPEGQRVVHDGFEAAWDLMIDQAAEHLRRWRG